MLFLYATMVGSCLIALGIGSYLLIIATIKCIKGGLCHIAQNSNAKTNYTGLLEQFNEVIEFHSCAKQLSKTIFCSRDTNNHFILFSIIRFIGDFSDLFQYLITMLFIFSLVTISGALLLIQHQIVTCIFLYIFATYTVEKEMCNCIENFVHFS